MESINDSNYWILLRKSTRVNGKIGKGQCCDWCEDALQKKDVAQGFTHQVAELGEIQIDQYATSVLEHHWLEQDGFIADGTAGQYDLEYPEGYYGLLDKAPDRLKEVYTKKII